MYDFIVDYYKVTDCNLDGAEYECQRRQQLQNTLLNTAYKQAKQDELSPILKLVWLCHPAGTVRTTQILSEQVLHPGPRGILGLWRIPIAKQRRREPKQCIRIRIRIRLTSSCLFTHSNTHSLTHLPIHSLSLWIFVRSSSYLITNLVVDPISDENTLLWSHWKIIFLSDIRSGSWSDFYCLGSWTTCP